MSFCGECGASLPELGKFCSECGNPRSFTNAALAPPPNTPEPEKVFLQDGTVTVTNSRFIVPGETFAMAGVTSVRFEKIEPSRRGAILLCGIGLILLLFQAYVIALGCIVIGIAWSAVLKTRYAVALSVSSGQKNAIESTRADYIRGIVDAVNRAIVYRR